ncbi:MAG: holo-ACP synthase [Candidatus Puniceispirillum sp.]|nr:holo-ACP synthase [Candidatus Pelagibacter sp.]MBA4283626.1 holo-ACP synthase [Candidatus Puniceispirillum sp.]
MFIIGTGIDLVDIKRIHTSLEKFGDQFLNRHFTNLEQKFAFKREHDISTSKGWTMASAALAKMFAAKEATLKAIGLTTGINWVDIEIKREASGKPYIVLYNQAEQNLNTVAENEAEKLGIAIKKGYIKKVINLSLTDEPPLAGAFVVISVVHKN